MRILVFGGTRGVGRHFVQAASIEGHEVTVLARDAEATSTWTPSTVRVVRGDAKDKNAVMAAVPGHDAVVISLGPSGRERLQHFIGRATQWIIEAMEKNGSRRLLLMSGLGVGESRKDAPPLMRWFVIPLVLGPTFADRAIAEDVTRRSNLDWTIIRPLYLTNETPRGRWNVTTEGRAVRRGIAREDVAAFLLQEIQSGEHIGKAVALHSS